MHSIPHEKVACKRNKHTVCIRILAAEDPKNIYNCTSSFMFSFQSPVNWNTWIITWSWPLFWNPLTTFSHKRANVVEATQIHSSVVPKQTTKCNQQAPEKFCSFQSMQKTVKHPQTSKCQRASKHNSRDKISLLKILLQKTIQRRSLTCLLPETDPQNSFFTNNIKR